MWFLLPLALLPACRGCKKNDASVTKPNDEPHASSPPVAEGCEAIAAAQCDASARYFPALIARLSEVGCRDDVAAQCTRIAEASGASAAFLVSCAATMKATEGEARWRAFYDGREPLCDWPKGPIADGGACTVNAECESENCAPIDTTASTGCGVCKKAPALGEACPERQCARGLACTDGHCTRPVDDAGCDANGCVAGMYCIDDHCVPPAKLGERCSFAGLTAPRCDPFSELACSIATGRCEKVQFAHRGEPCGIIAEKSVLCGEGLRCAYAAGDDPLKTNGTCAPPVAIGGACPGEMGWAVCDTRAQCIGGTCVIPKREDCAKK